MTNYDAAQAQALDYCTYCPRLCHFACPAAVGDGTELATPWGKMTLANLERKGEIALDDALAHVFYLCASCHRCRDFCTHDQDVPDVLEIARARAVDAGVAPLAVLEMRDAYPAFGAATAPEPALTHYLAKPRDTARIAFFPSCTHREGFDGDRLDRILELLSAVAGEPVALAWRPDVSCCGGRARAAGLGDVASAHQPRFEDAIRGFDLLITDCVDLIVDAAPESVQVSHLMQFLAAHTAALTSLATRPRPGVYQRHGGCKERRTLDLTDDETAVLDAIGVAWQAVPAYQDSDECCGGDPVFASTAPEAARAAGQVLLDIFAERPGPVVTSAHRCHTHLGSCGATETSSILDLVLDQCSTPQTLG